MERDTATNLWGRFIPPAPTPKPKGRKIMQKINGFTINQLTLSGFKGFAEEQSFTFGDTTFITGQNASGKSSVADAIAFAVTGQPFFGDRSCDRLQNPECGVIDVTLFFTDDAGTEHTLNRRRKSGKMSITMDGCAIRQADIHEIFGERDVLAKERSPEKLIKLFAKHQAIVADELSYLKNVHSVIGTFMELLIEGVSAMETEISASVLPERRIILGDENDFCMSVGFYREFMRFCNAPHEPTLNLSYPIGGFFESMDVFLNEPSQPTRFFSLDPNGKDKKEAGLYLIGYTRGYYGQTNDLPKRMAAYAKKNGLVFIGPVYNIYLFDEMSITDTERYLLQVSAAVKETRATDNGRYCAAELCHAPCAPRGRSDKHLRLRSQAH